MNREQQFQQELISSVRRTLTAMLSGAVYRNAGEMPHYEDPIRDMMVALNWRNQVPEQRVELTGVILAIFDNMDYPGRGTFPQLETPIHQTMAVLNQALEANINRIRALYGNF